MLFVLSVLIASVVGAWLFAAGPGLKGSARGVTRRPTGGRAPDTDPAPAGPQSLEGVLVGQLVAGEITGSQYRHAMADVAARDAERHPFEVPPDVAPPEAV